MMTEHVDRLESGAALLHSSSLMTNYESGRVAAPGRHVTAVTDASGNPMLFTVAEDAGTAPSALYLTYRDPKTSTGWSQLNLTATLPAGTNRCQAVAVAQFADGTITVAVAVGDTLQGASRLYVTAPLGDDPTAADWGKLSASWRARPAPAALSGVVISAISLGDAPSGIAADDGGALMFVAAAKGGSSTYYIVATGATAPKDWAEVAPPDGATSVQIVLPATTALAGAGTYALYEHGQGSQVGFQGAPGSNPFGVSQKFTLQVPGDVQAIATGTGQDGFNSLFLAGGTGLQYLAPRDLQGNAEPTTLIGGDAFRNLKQIAVTEAIHASGRMSVWLVDADDNLLFATASKSDPTRDVSGPFLFKQAVAQIAAVQNHVRGASEVVLVGIDGKLSYLWQDPETTLWTEQVIPLYTTSENLKFTCYTTALHLEDTDGTPVAADLDLRASAWSYVTVNGAPHVLGPDAAVTVPTDATGTVTIVQKVTSIAVPNYTVTSKALSDAVQVVPSAGIKAKLDQIKSGADLANATDQATGAPVFAQGDLSFDDAAKAIGKLTALHPKPGAGQSLRAVPHALSFGTGIDHAAHTGTWALVRTDAGLTHIDGAAAEAHAEPLFATGSSAWDDFKASAGDALRWLDHAAEDVSSFIAKAVDGVVHFAITIGKAVVRFVVDTAEQVYAAISYVLKKIGAAIEKIIQWIGFLFEWDDILATHAAMSAYAVKGFDYLIEELQNAEDKVETFFDTLKSNLEAALDLPDGTPAGDMGGPARDTGKKASGMKSPGASFSTYHLQHSGMLSARGDAAVNPVSGLDDWITGILGKEFADIRGDFEKGAHQLADFHKNGTLSAENVAKVVLEIITDAVLDTVKNVAIGALEFAELLVKLVRSGITAKIHIPFLSPLYKDLTGHDLTLLDAMSLLLAIPVTVLYKTAANRAPFSRADAKAIENATVAQVFGPKPRSLGAAAATSGVPAENVYSDIGAITGGVGGVITMICGAISAQSEEDVPLVPKVQLGVSVVGLFLSLPVKQGPAQGWQVGGFGIACFATVFGGLVYLQGKSVQTEQSGKFIAAVGIVTSVIRIVPQTGGLIASATSKNGAGPLSYVGYFCAVLGDIGGVCNGGAKFADDVRVKELLVAAALSTSGLAAFGNIALGIAQAADE